MRALVLCAVLLGAGLTGCIGGEHEAEAPALAPASTAPAEPVIERVQGRFIWEAEPRTGASACWMPWGCTWLVTDGDPGRLSPPPYSRHAEGTLERFEIRATWEPTTPLAQELNLTVFMEVPRAQGGGHEGILVAKAVGPSPLVLEAEAPPGAEPYFLLYIRPGPTPVPQVNLIIEQDVHVEGTYTWLREVPR